MKILLHIKLKNVIIANQRIIDVLLVLYNKNIKTRKGHAN
jgi:hypothetical protein